MMTAYMYALGESGGTEGAFKKAIVWERKESLQDVACSGKCAAVKGNSQAQCRQVIRFKNI